MSSPHLDTPPQPEKPRRCFGGGSLAAVAIVVVVLALVSGFLAQAGVFSAKRAHGNRPAANSSATRKTFQDGDGLYTLQMPSDWQVQTNVDSGTVGMGSQGSFSQDMEVVTLGTDPAAGIGAVNVRIEATPIANGALAHSYYCGDALGFPSSQKFDGISATAMGSATWFFSSADAHFQIDATIPGVLVPPHTSPVELTPLPTATPLPPSQVASDQADVNEILTSFQLKDPKPLAC